MLWTDRVLESRTGKSFEADSRVGNIFSAVGINGWLPPRGDRRGVGTASGEEVPCSVDVGAL